MSLVSSVWREVTQKLGLSKAIIGFCTIVGEKVKEKPNLRMRSASRLSLVEAVGFEPTSRLRNYLISSQVSKNELGGI